jgi:hypothetical protein
MIMKLDASDFRQQFKNYNRENQFSPRGLDALFEYLEEIDENWELDVIALCCDFTEYESLEELQKEYEDIESLDDLRDHTSVIEFGNGELIIQAF